MPEVEPLGIHIHKTWELAFIATGVGERETGGTIKAFSKGNLVLIPPGMPHEWRFGTDVAGGENGVLITVNFASGLFAKLASAFPELEYMSKMFGDFSTAWTFKKTLSDAVGRIMASMANEGESMRGRALWKYWFALRRSAIPLWQEFRPTKPGNWSDAGRLTSILPPHLLRNSMPRMLHGGWVCSPRLSATFSRRITPRISWTT